MIYEMIREMKAAYNKAHGPRECAEALHMSKDAYSELCLELDIFDLRQIDGLLITTYNGPRYFVGIGGPKR